MTYYKTQLLTGRRLYRNEHGDADGFGSKVCRAEAGALNQWTCKHDPKKYDSPLIFEHDDRILLVGRRNITETGNFDLGKDELPLDEQFVDYQLAYWMSPKRCALWEVDPLSLTVKHLADLPSAGDTCFASVLRLGVNTYEIWNYTSPLDAPDISWFNGQTGQTSIYRIGLHFYCTAADAEDDDWGTD